MRRRRLARAQAELVRDRLSFGVSWLWARGGGCRTRRRSGCSANSWCAPASRSAWPPGLQHALLPAAENQTRTRKAPTGRNRPPARGQEPRNRRQNPQQTAQPDPEICSHQPELRVDRGVQMVQTSGSRPACRTRFGAAKRSAYGRKNYCGTNIFRHRVKHDSCLAYTQSRFP